MTMGRILTIAGGGIVVAMGIFFFSQALEPRQAVGPDLNRDICVSFNNEKLAVSDVHGQLHENAPIENPHWDEKERKYWVEMKQLISAHNLKHEAVKYRFVTGVSFQMNLVPYRGMASFVICSYEDVNACRNRNFWFFKRIPPKQLAQIVFNNTIKKDIKIKRCPF